MSFFKSGMDLPNQGRGILPEEQEAVFEKLAKWVVRKGMTVPAIMALESVKPLNYVSSQTMVFFEPIFQAIFNMREYDIVREALERRESIEILILRIEEFDAVAYRKERAFKKWFRQEKKKWKWYQRWLGIARPKLQPPDEVLNPPEAGSTAAKSEDKPKKEPPDGIPPELK